MGTTLAGFATMILGSPLMRRPSLAGACSRTRLHWIRGPARSRLSCLTTCDPVLRQRVRRGQYDRPDEEADHAEPYQAANDTAADFEQVKLPKVSGGGAGATGAVWPEAGPACSAAGLSEGVGSASASASAAFSGTETRGGRKLSGSR